MAGDAPQALLLGRGEYPAGRSLFGCAVMGCSVEKVMDSRLDLVSNVEGSRLDR